MSNIIFWQGTWKDIVTLEGHAPGSDGRLRIIQLENGALTLEVETKDLLGEPAWEAWDEGEVVGVPIGNDTRTRKLSEIVIRVLRLMLTDRNAIIDEYSKPIKELRDSKLRKSNDERCQECGGDLGGARIGRVENHRPDCPLFPK